MNKVFAALGLNPWVFFPLYIFAMVLMLVYLWKNHRWEGVFYGSNLMISIFLGQVLSRLGFGNANYIAVFFILSFYGLTRFYIKRSKRRSRKYYVHGSSRNRGQS